MYKFLMKNGQAVAFAVAVVLVAIFLFIAIPGANGIDYEAMPLAQKMKDTNFDFGISAAIFLAIAAFVLAFVVFGLMGLAKNPKSGLGLIVGLIAIVVLYFIGQTFDGNPSAQLSAIMQEFDITSSVSKIITGAMFTGIVMAVLAFIALVLGELKGLFS